MYYRAMSLLYIKILRHIMSSFYRVIIRLYQSSFISSFGTTLSSSLVIFDSFDLIIIWSFPLKSHFAHGDRPFYLLLRPFVQDRDLTPD